MAGYVGAGLFKWAASVRGGVMVGSSCFVESVMRWAEAVALCSVDSLTVRCAGSLVGDGLGAAGGVLGLGVDLFVWGVSLATGVAC